MARPSKSNPKGKQVKQARVKANEDGSLQKLFDALKTGLTRGSAIAWSGIPMTTVYQWLKDDENFRMKFEAHEEMRIALVENKKAGLINRGYRPAIERELKSKRRDVYGDKLDQDQNIKFDGNIEIKLPE